MAAASLLLASLLLRARRPYFSEYVRETSPNEAAAAARPRNPYAARDALGGLRLDAGGAEA